MLETSEQVMSVFPAVMFVRAHETHDQRGQNRTCVVSQSYAKKRLLWLSQSEIIFSRWNHEECGLSVEETDLLKSESSTASNMHGRGNQALSCSNLFPLINSHRSTGCHPLGWALAPHTTRPRSHGYGSLWGPSSNLSSVTPGACRSHCRPLPSFTTVPTPAAFTRTITCPAVRDLLDKDFLKIFYSIYTQQNILELGKTRNMHNFYSIYTENILELGKTSKIDNL